MSTKELDQLSTVPKILVKCLTQAQAAQQIGLTIRRVKQLVRGAGA